MRTKRKGKAVDRESMTIVVGLTVSMEWHFYLEIRNSSKGLWQKGDSTLTHI